MRKTFGLKDWHPSPSFFVSVASKGLAREMLVSADSARLKVAVFSMVCGWLVSADSKGFTGASCILIGILFGTADSKGVRRTACGAGIVRKGTVVPTWPKICDPDKMGIYNH